MVTGQTHFLSPQTPPHTHLSHHLRHISYSHALHWSAAKHFACNSRYLQLHPFMHKTSKVHASCTFSAYHHFHSTPRAGEVGYIQRCFKAQKRLEPLQLTQCLHRDVGAWERQGRAVPVCEGAGGVYDRSTTVAFSGSSTCTGRKVK